MKILSKLNKTKIRIITAVVTIIYTAVSFYFSLPPINLQAEEFYTFFLGKAILCFAVYYGLCAYKKFKHPESVGVADGFDFTIKSLVKSYIIPVIVVGSILIVLLIGSLISAPIFNAGSYHKLLNVENGNFTEDITEINFSNIPTLDKASAEKLGNKKMGEMAEWISQFEVSDLYTQINFNKRPTRVTPLLYGDFFKWWNNKSDGIPAYMRIDMVTQEVTCVKLDEGIKYSESEYFNRNIERHLRFKYPTYIFDTPVFEIDDEGRPYWICTKLKRTIGLFGGQDVDGVVVCDAVTGECEYYEDGKIPQWIDKAYSAELLIEQYDYYGRYINGYWNTLFGQSDMKQTTEGYNYIALNDDVYVYTGVTSVSGDEANIGFVLMNQRTKETKFYSIAGAMEYSAMDSAEGQVQHLKYIATFPLLLNTAGQPTYFIPLKDNSNLVKKYSMVNVSQYQIVAIGDTIKECEEAYIKLLKESNIIEDDAGNDVGDNTDIADKVDIIKVEGKITDIRTAIINGNTYYYIYIDGSDKVFSISALADEMAVMLNPGDMVVIEYEDSQANKSNVIVKIKGIKIQIKTE